MTITSTQLKRKTSLVDNAVEEDILVTKRGKPYVVIIDDTRYEELIANQLSDEEKNKVTDASRKPRDGWDEKFKDRG